MSTQKSLPNLHQGAFRYKNFKKLQRDGGRAWIKDSQLHSAIRGVDPGIVKQEDSSSKQG